MKLFFKKKTKSLKSIIQTVLGNTPLIRPNKSCVVNFSFPLLSWLCVGVN